MQNWASNSLGFHGDRGILKTKEIIFNFPGLLVTPRLYEVRGAKSVSSGRVENYIKYRT